MLLPRDHWQHRFSDLLAALWVGVRHGRIEPMVPLPGMGEGIATQSGRVGLVLALQALGLRAGARVGVPLFCCPVVFQAIRTAGCTPCFLDVDPRTYLVCGDNLAAKSGALDAVVAVHLFGQVCDVPSMRAIVGATPIIEDCAQALGSRWMGRPAGSWGDAAVFSFRSGKYLSAGWGGAVTAADLAVRRQLAGLASGLPRPGWQDEVRHALVQYGKSHLRSRPMYGWVGHRLWSAHADGRRGEAEAAIRVGGPFASDFAVVRRRWDGLERAVAIQRAHATLLEQRLRWNSECLCPEPAGAEWNRFHFPIQLRSEAERDAIAAGLWRQGIDCSRYLNDVVEVARRHYGYRGGCQVSEELSRRVLVPPAHHGLATGAVERVAQALNAAWAEQGEVAGRMGAGALGPRMDAEVA